MNMKKKSFLKKLALTKQTIASLSNSTLIEVKGGVKFTYGTDCVEKTNTVPLSYYIICDTNYCPRPSIGCDINNPGTDGTGTTNTRTTDQ